MWKRAVLARSVIFNLAGKAGTLILGFTASVVLARSIGPANRGLLGIMVSTSELTLALAGLGLGAAVLYFASRDPSLEQRLFGNGLLYAGVLAAVLLVVAAFAHGPIADLIAHGRSGEKWLLVAAYAPVLLVDVTVQALLLARLRFGVYNVFLVVARAAYLLGVLVLVAWCGLGVTGGLIALIGGSLTMIACGVGVLRGSAVPTPDARLFRAMARYGARVQVGTLFQAIFFRFDVVLLQFFVSLKEVGQYVVAASLAELIVQLALAFQLSVGPLTAHSEHSDEQAATTASAVRHHGILSVVATLANVLVGPLAILFVYGPDFHDALAPMLILLPGMWFVGTGLVVAGDLRGRGRPGTASALGGATVVLVVALDLTLIPPLGIQGAALASLFAYAVFGVASLRTLARVAEIPLRHLVVPTRADFALYRNAPGAAFAWLRSAAGAPGGR